MLQVACSVFRVLCVSNVYIRIPHCADDICYRNQAMGTSDVRVDVGLNKAVWSNGVRNVPRRVRVRLSRKRNEDEEAQEKLYTLVTHVEEVTSFKGLETMPAEE